MVTNAGKMKANGHCERRPVPSLLKVKYRNAVPSGIWQKRLFSAENKMPLASETNGGEQRNTAQSLLRSTHLGRKQRGLCLHPSKARPLPLSPSPQKSHPSPPAWPSSRKSATSPRPAAGRDGSPLLRARALRLCGRHPFLSALAVCSQGPSRSRGLPSG